MLGFIRQSALISDASEFFFSVSLQLQWSSIALCVPGLQSCSLAKGAIKRGRVASHCRENVLRGLFSLFLLETEISSRRPKH